LRLQGKRPSGNLVRKRRSDEAAMDDDDTVKKPPAHEVGMGIDAMSVAELELRIDLLETEIRRLRAAIDSRRQSRAAADSFFKR